MGIYSLFSVIAAAFAFLIATFVLWRGRSRQNVFFALLTYAISVWTSFPWLMHATPIYQHLWIARIVYLPAVAVPVLFLAFVLVVLERPLTHHSLKLASVASVLLAANIQNPAFIQDVRILNGICVPMPGSFYAAFVLYFGIICGYAFILLMQSYATAEGMKRNKLRFIFLSFILAYLSGLLHFIAAYTIQEPVPHDLLIVSFVAILAYAILKHRLMDITVILRKTLIYSVVTGTLTVIYLGIIALAAHLFEGLAGYQTIFSSAVAACLITVGFQPLRKRVQGLVDSKFFRQYVDREEKLYELSREVVTHTTPEAMAEALMQVLKETLHPKSGVLYLKARQGAGFEPNAAWGDSLKIAMEDSNPLASYFADHPQPFVQELSADVGGPRDTRNPDHKSRNAA